MALRDLTLTFPRSPSAWLWPSETKRSATPGVMPFFLKLSATWPTSPAAALLWRHREKRPAIVLWTVQLSVPAPSSHYILPSFRTHLLQWSPAGAPKTAAVEGPCRTPAFLSCFANGTVWKFLI